MTTWTWQDCTPTPEEEEAWHIMEKEFEHEQQLKAQQKDERKTAWIGEFEFLKARYGVNDRTGGEMDLCLIHRLHEVRECAEDDLEKIALEEALDWIIPNEYRGEIAFSQGFMRNLGGNLKRFDKEGI